MAKTIRIFLSCITCSLFLFVQPPTAIAQGGVPDVYAAQVEGQRVELQLFPNGGALFMGRQGSWQRNANGNLISGQSGSLQASVQRQTVVFVVNKTKVVLQKTSGPNRGSQPSKALRRFAPKKILKGGRYSIKNSQTS